MAQQPPDRARVETTTARGQEDGVIRAGCKLRPPGLEVARELERGLLAERDHAFLSSLAAHVHDLAVEVDVREVERDGLLAPQSGGVEELQQCAVAQREWRLAVDELEELVDFGRLRRIGKPTPAPRRE